MHTILNWHLLKAIVLLEINSTSVTYNINRKQSGPLFFNQIIKLVTSIKEVFEDKNVKYGQMK